MRTLSKVSLARLLLFLCCLYFIVNYFSGLNFFENNRKKTQITSNVESKADLIFKKADFSSIFDYTNLLTPARKQAAAVKSVLTRTIPNHAHLFDIKINFKLVRHTFRITKTNLTETVSIEASSGVIACKAFYYYLKYYCNSHISWDGSNIQIPKYLPEINVTETSPSQFIFYQNVCAYSYSYAFWQWSDWRKHIDWMAMQGISLTIAPVQELIWERVYIELGLTKTDIDEHFAGPAFLAWQRMGNIRGWGGPLTATFKKQSLELQKKIIFALRELGVVVALPAFAGHVPRAFKEIYPNASYQSIVNWKKGFPDCFNGPLILEPNNDLFTNVGTLFLEKIVAEYGTNHIYFADPFYKIQRSQANAKYLMDVGNAIYGAMQMVDNEAVWMLQSWIFEKNPFLSSEHIRALLTTAPIGKMIVLDLKAEQQPYFNRTSSFFGQPFIWCMLHNFGATLGMHGSIDVVNEDIVKASKFQDSSMIGVGIVPEGINPNYALYEFTLERGWYQNSVNIKKWLKRYTFVRYGVQSDLIARAWDTLVNSVYSLRDNREIEGKYIVCRQPSLNYTIWPWYDLRVIDDVLGDLLAASLNMTKPNNLFEDDLVDCTRQMIQNKVDLLYEKIVESFENKKKKEFHFYRNQFENLLQDLDRILSTNEKFLLGRYLETAKALATSDYELKSYEFNARNQITIWGPTGQVYDYAMKQWSGMMIDYCLPRWTFFFERLSESLDTEQYFNETECKKNIFKIIEEPFVNDNKLYKIHGFGDAVATSSEIYKKWKK